MQAALRSEERRGKQQWATLLSGLYVTFIIIGGINDAEVFV